MVQSRDDYTVFSSDIVGIVTSNQLVRITVADKVKMTNTTKDDGPDQYPDFFPEVHKYQHNKTDIECELCKKSLAASAPQCIVQLHAPMTVGTPTFYLRVLQICLSQTVFLLLFSVPRRAQMLQLELILINITSNRFCLR